MHTSILDLLEDRATRFGSRPLYDFVESHEVWSAADVLRRAALFGTHLANSSIEGGERVGLLIGDRRRFIEAFFGCQYRGAVPVPIGISGRVGSAPWHRRLEGRIQALRLKAVVTDDQAVIDATSKTRVMGMDHSVGAALPPGDRQAIAFIQPSSGTTGQPKGVVLSQSAVIANIAAISEVLAADASDHLMTWLPFFHDMGLVGTVLTPLYSGSRTAIWSPEGFVTRPRDWFGIIEQLGITITVLPPFGMDSLNRVARRYRGSNEELATLRSVMVGSELIRPRVLESFVSSLVPRGLSLAAIMPVYGLAEATLAVTMTRADQGYRIVELGQTRSVTCGTAVPGVELRIQHPSNELLVRTPSAMDGYLGDDESTARAFDGEWLRTGDLALIDENELVIVGRASESINRNGIRIPASDFEATVADVEGVRPDRVIAFQIDHDDRHAVVVVAEITDLTSRDETNLRARRQLAEAGLQADVVHLVPLGWLPRTTSGKLRRSAARRRFERERAEYLVASVASSESVT